ncbi:MAG TPA: hypothetical protein VNV66_09745 [Pilimelia sp.]|nr:hypothetical protein [Pilimelia sp.]
MRRLTSTFVALVACVATIGATQTAPSAAAPAPAAAATPESLVKSTGLAILSPHHLRALSVADRDAAMSRMVDDLRLFRVQTVRLEFAIRSDEDVAATLETLYRPLLSKLAAANIKVIALLDFSLVESGVINDPYRKRTYVDQFEVEWCDNPVICHGSPLAPNTSYARYGPVTTFMDKWLSRALITIGTFRDSITAVEILNEANKTVGQGYYLPPDVCGRLVAKLHYYCKVNETAPCYGKTLITVGMHPATDDPGEAELAPIPPSNCKAGQTGMLQRNNDTCYIDLLYRSPAYTQFREQHARYPGDAFGYHPYPWAINGDYDTSDNTLDDLLDLMLGRYAEVRAKLNEWDPGKYIWLTEAGFDGTYQVADPAPAPGVSRADYSQVVQEQFIIKLHHRFFALTGTARPYMLVYYRYHDYINVAEGHLNIYGLVVHRSRDDDPHDSHDDWDHSTDFTQPPDYKRDVVCTYIEVRRPPSRPPYCLGT